MKMEFKVDISKYRILLLAIIISFIWHIFWLSAISIVKPSVKKPVKFSKVSFLGPILQRGTIEVRVGSLPRSFLEDRYLGEMKSGPFYEASKTKDIHAMQDTGTSFSYMNKTKFTELIDGAIGLPKSEPAGHIE